MPIKKLSIVTIIFLVIASLLYGCKTGNEGSSGEIIMSDGTFYVSTDIGDDNNSGTSDEPLKTIQAAAQKMKPGDTCVINDGVYYEVIIPPTGEEGNPISFVAAEGTRPVVTGTLNYEGEWTKFKDNIFVTDVTDVYDNFDKNNFQVFVNEEAIVEARWPNIPEGKLKNIMDYKREIAAPGTDSYKIVAPYFDGENDVSGARLTIWPGPEGGSGWVTFTRTVKEYDSELRAFILENPLYPPETRNSDIVYYPVYGNAYFVHGSMSLLDAPGEYYLDKEDKKLYVYLPEGKTPEDFRISLRRHTFAFLLDDLSDVHLKGLTFYGSGIPMNRTKNSIIEDCKILYAEHLIEMNGYMANGYNGPLRVTGENNLITECEIGITAGSGITVGGKGNRIINNIIHDSNYSGADFAAIYIDRVTDDLNISNNTIYNSSRAHLFIAVNANLNNVIIENNYFENHSVLNSDCGAIYTWGSDGNDTTIIRNNYIVGGDKGDNGAHQELRMGIYFDSYTSGYSAYRNIIKDVVVGLKLNHPSINHKLVNNTVINARDFFGFYGVSQDEAIFTGTEIYNNLGVDIKSQRDFYYYGTERGNYISRNGNLIDGEIPIPNINEIDVIPVFRHMNNPVNYYVENILEAGRKPESGGNLRGEIDQDYSPIGNAVDGGFSIEGITDIFAGDAPDIGAIESGDSIFTYGATWSIEE